MTFLHSCKHDHSVIPCRASCRVGDVRESGCCDTCGCDRNVRKSLSFAHSGLLCCDPWSDSLGWLLTAPATLYQADDSRGSLTWVQGKCNVMHALQGCCRGSASPTFSIVSSFLSKCHISGPVWRSKQVGDLLCPQCALDCTCVSV